MHYALYETYKWPGMSSPKKELIYDDLSDLEEATEALMDFADDRWRENEHKGQPSDYMDGLVIEPQRSTYEPQCDSDDSIIEEFWNYEFERWNTENMDSDLKQYLNI